MENIKNIESIKNDNISDMEQIQLTSRNYTNKNQISKKVLSKPTIIIFHIIIVIYLFVLFLYLYITNIKNKFIREMSEKNRIIGLNQNYERVNPNDKNYTYIPIVGTDDIHGYFFPKVNNIKINNGTLTYKTGGLEYISKYINILRDEFGANRVLYFDSGDSYPGGIDSFLFDGEIIKDFFNIIGLNGTTIGNHELDY